MRQRTPWEIAVEWYKEEEITRTLLSIGADSLLLGSIPETVRSEEFAKWITHQYRLAMAKGIQLGRDCSEDGTGIRYLPCKEDVNGEWVPDTSVDMQDRESEK